MFVTQQMAEVVDLGQARERRLSRAAEPWVGKREVATHFGVSVRTVENYMKAGLPHTKRFQGSPVRFRLSVCDEWFQR